MHRVKDNLIAAALLAVAAGCAAPPPAPTAAPAAVLPQPPPAAPPQAPDPGPVYRNPRIGVIYLRAHEDEEGRLLGPQAMYQITDPGGWNVDALDGGNSPAPSAASPLADPVRAAGITITGLMDRGDRARAEGIAAAQGPGRVAVFDEQAGWLILGI